MVDNWDDFLEIEKKYGLNYLEIDGCNFWQYGRSMLMEYLTTVSLGGGRQEIAKNSFNALKVKKAYRLAAFIIRSRIGRAKFDKHCDVLFASAVNRVPYNGKSYNALVDPIMDCYENSILLEPSYMFRKHYSNPYSKTVCYIDYYEANAIIAYYLHRITKDFRKKLQDIKSQLAEPMKLVCELYNISTLPEFVYINMADCITRRKSYKKFCREVLSVTLPRVVVETCHYSFENLVLTETAYEMGIPVVELQHGSAGKGHYAYNYADGVSVKQFPTYFFAFSKFWMSCFSLPIPQKSIFSVGAPYKEARAHELCEVEKPAKKIILFLSESRNFSNDFVKMAIEINNKIDKNEYELMLKLHPNEYNDWKNKYPDVVGTGIKVIDSNNPELYTLFSMATYQVCSYNSTTVYEGMLFGLKTFINTNIAGPEFMTLCEKGYAEGFTSAHELLEKITSADNNKVDNEFWENDSLMKMKNALDSVILDSFDN